MISNSISVAYFIPVGQFLILPFVGKLFLFVLNFIENFNTILIVNHPFCSESHPYLLKKSWPLPYSRFPLYSIYIIVHVALNNA